MREIVDTILTVYGGNAGGFVILALLVLAFGGALFRTTAGRIKDLDRRLTACDARHADCEARNRQLARAMVELASGNGDDARARARVILDE